MSSEQIEIAIIQIIEELIVIKREYEAREKRIWVKKWIKRRNEFGASNTLLKELAVEDPKSYFNYLRINEEMFSTLLEKVNIYQLYQLFYIFLGYVVYNYNINLSLPHILLCKLNYNYCIICPK